MHCYTLYISHKRALNLQQSPTLTCMYPQWIGFMPKITRSVSYKVPKFRWQNFMTSWIKALRAPTRAPTPFFPVPLSCALSLCPCLCMCVRVCLFAYMHTCKFVYQLTQIPRTTKELGKEKKRTCKILCVYICVCTLYVFVCMSI